MLYILGLSACNHDSAALLGDGNILSAAHEERFTCEKHDSRSPLNVGQLCLDSAGTGITDIIFCNQPLVKFEHLLETHLSYTRKGFRSFISAIPIWLKEKLSLRNIIKNELAQPSACNKQQLPNLLFSEHRQSYVANNFNLITQRNRSNG